MCKSPSHRYPSSPGQETHVGETCETMGLDVFGVTKRCQGALHKWWYQTRISFLCGKSLISPSWPPRFPCLAHCTQTCSFFGPSTNTDQVEQLAGRWPIVRSRAGKGLHCGAETGDGEGSERKALSEEDD